MELFYDIFSIKTVMYHFNLGSGYDLSYIEAVGTVFGLLCIWFASKEKRYNFYFGLVNVTLFAIIFYQIQLYANLLLQVFFWLMNIYGLYAWGKSKDENNNLEIRWLSKTHLIITVITAAIAIAVLTIYIDQFFAMLTHIALGLIRMILPTIGVPDLQADPYPLMDATITVLSVIAMVQMTRKLVENWLIWVLINLISIVLYAKQGVYFMSLEYVLLLFIAINGSLEWIRAARTKS